MSEALNDQQALEKGDEVVYDVVAEEAFVPPFLVGAAIKILDGPPMLYMGVCNGDLKGKLPHKTYYEVVLWRVTQFEPPRLFGLSISEDAFKYAYEICP